jgi:hypothetical protein
MTPNDAMDASDDGVQRLLTLVPDASRAERTRRRCHAELARRRRRAASTAAIAGSSFALRAMVDKYAWRVVAPAVVGGVCVLYAAALLATTLRLGLE